MARSRRNHLRLASLPASSAAQTWSTSQWRTLRRASSQFRKLQVLLKRPDGDREMVEILLLLLNDEQMVLATVEPASEGAPNKQTVLNILSRLIDSPSVPPVQTLHIQG